MDRLFLWKDQREESKSHCEAYWQVRSNYSTVHSGLLSPSAFSLASTVLYLALTTDFVHRLFLNLSQLIEVPTVYSLNSKLCSYYFYYYYYYLFIIIIIIIILLFLKSSPGEPGTTERNEQDPKHWSQVRSSQIWGGRKGTFRIINKSAFRLSTTTAEYI